MSWLTPDVVAAVAQHMNDDHRDDLLVMVAGLAPEAVTARVRGLNRQALLVEVESAAGRTREVALPWPAELTQRSDIRTYVVQMHTDALGGTR